MVITFVGIYASKSKSSNLRSLVIVHGCSGSLAVYFFSRLLPLAGWDSASGARGFFPSLALALREPLAFLAGFPFLGALEDDASVFGVFPLLTFFFGFAGPMSFSNCLKGFDMKHANSNDGFGPEGSNYICKLLGFTSMYVNNRYS